MRTGAVKCVLILAVWIVPASSLRSQNQQAPIRHSNPTPQSRVDINRASLEQLLKLPGLTRPWAERILRFRPYRSKQELIDQGILSGEVYRRIKDYVIAHREKP